MKVLLSQDLTRGEAWAVLVGICLIHTGPRRVKGTMWLLKRDREALLSLKMSATFVSSLVISPKNANSVLIELIS
jgi:hypothetical protein